VDSEVMMGIPFARRVRADASRGGGGDSRREYVQLHRVRAKESVDTILEMAEHKKFGARRIDCAGCLVERYRNQILEQVPEVDAVVGTGEVERIIERSKAI